MRLQTGANSNSQISDLTDNKANTLTSQGSEQSTENRTKPVKLSDLPQHRVPLLHSQNSAAQALGSALAAVHIQFQDGEIPIDIHRLECLRIKTEADLLRRGMTRSNTFSNPTIAGIPSENKVLTKQEYLAICDDLMVQLDPENGIEAIRQRTLQEATQVSKAQQNPSDQISKEEIKASADLSALLNPNENSDTHPFSNQESKHQRPVQQRLAQMRAKAQGVNLLSNTTSPVQQRLAQKKTTQQVNQPQNKT